MEVKNYTFRDAELRSTPLKLVNRIGGLVARTGYTLPSLDAKTIVHKAQERARLNDFGSESFREPLEQYLDSIAEDAQLSTFGRIAVKEMLVGSLANRLRLVDWHRQHPLVSNEVIEKPWIIVGLPRTGTSLLSILLGLNPEARPLLHWEAAQPIPPADLASAGDDPRIAECARDLDRLHSINPTLRAMHPFGAMIAQECTALFMYDLRTLGIETQAFVPGYGKWLAAADMTPAYHLHKQTLQAMQAAQPTAQWVLKSPNHLWCLETLLATYPDARIIWTHRNPADVVTSLASLTNALQWPLTTRRDPKPVANEWNAKAFDAINKAMAFDKRSAADWCYHLRYEDLIADSSAVMEKLFAHFGLEMSPLHKRRVTKWLEYRPKNVFGKHHYDAADFGWNKAALDEQYQDYSRRYC